MQQPARDVVLDAIDAFTREYPDWSPHHPDDVKELSRAIYAALDAAVDPEPGEPE